MNRKQLYNLELAKSKIDMLDFQLYCMKDNPSEKDVNVYVKNVNKGNSNKFPDLSNKDISKLLFQNLEKGTLFEKKYNCIDDFLSQNEPKRKYLDHIPIQKMCQENQMKYAKTFPDYIIDDYNDGNTEISEEILEQAYVVYEYPEKGDPYLNSLSNDKLESMILKNPYLFDALENITKETVRAYLMSILINQKHACIGYCNGRMSPQIPDKFKDFIYYRCYCISEGFNFRFIPEDKFAEYVDLEFINHAISQQTSFTGPLHIAETLAKRNFDVPMKVWERLCYLHFSAIEYVPKKYKTPRFFDNLMEMPDYHYSILVPEMSDAQIIETLKHSKYVSPDNIKKLNRWTPEIIHEIFTHCHGAYDIIPKKYWTEDLIRIGLKNETIYLSNVPQQFITKDLCVYAYHARNFRTMEDIPDEYKDEEFFKEIMSGPFTPKDIPDKYLTKDFVIQYVQTEACRDIICIPKTWKTDDDVLKAFSSTHITEYIYPDEQHEMLAVEAAKNLTSEQVRMMVARNNCQPEELCIRTIKECSWGLSYIKNPTREMVDLSVSLYPSSILYAPEWYLNTETEEIKKTDETILPKKTASMHTYEFKNEAVAETVVESASLENQLSIFDFMVTAV